MKRILITVLTLCITIPAFAQKDKIREEIDIKVLRGELNDVSEFLIKNVNGDVEIQGYDGNEIIITGTKVIEKKKGDITREEADEFYLKKEKIGDKVYVYFYAPGVQVKFKDGKINYNIGWDRKEDRFLRKFEYHFDIKVMVPDYLYVSASTINDGDVTIADLKRGVNAGNINGAVLIKEISGRTQANTVNGDIEVWFANSPKEDSEFNTVNGTIEIYSPKDLSTVVTFESLNGELYTDFENVKRLPNRLNKEKDGKGFRYRISKQSPIQIGQGGPEMEFKMVNGSVYIRERKS